ncbi:hypothetical protein [Pseudomonas sp. BBP2017]|uniref:hypothetical protein n=1 Tax=Pseudomonas sp. BBP2017 TaxID=2109731 RepID=UPI000D121E83|nr:hypothetical protein [Pseudomonas sp. BBP2017]PSS47408.1 hypothetical protein C6382_21680 [Pseudomonas sp. BBP2017]
MTSTNLKVSTVAPSGSVTATLVPPGAVSEKFSGTYFDAYRYQNELHLWAEQGDVSGGKYDAILLLIPFDTADGAEHEILPGEPGETGKIRAVFFTPGSAAWAVKGGKLLNFKWGQDQQSVAFEFHFDVEVEGKVRSIENGVLELRYDVPRHTKGIKAETGSVSATIAPPVFPGHEQFQSSEILFEKDSTGGYYRLTARHIFDGSVPEVHQGIMLRISTENPKPGVFAFFIRNHGIYLTTGYQLENVEWDKEGQTFKADFSFDVDLSPGMHALRDGKIDIGY